MAQIPLAVETAQSRSTPLTDERLLNFFTERQTPTAKAQQPLFGRPGLTAFATTGATGCRGSWVAQGVLYVVSADGLYSISKAGTATLLGSGIGGSSPVSMSDNGKQLIVVNGVNGWIYDLTALTFKIIDSPNFYPAKTVIFFDGYFILDRLGTNQFFLSALYDGTKYIALDFASAEAEPGFVTAAQQNLQLLFVFTANHIEMWYDAGTASFPFQRYAGGVINYGCNAPYSIVKQDGAIFFLGTDKVFYRLQANIPIRVSTHAIEHILAQDTDLTVAQAFTYTLEGHKFVVLTLPTSQRTLVFDISTGLWHEADSVDANYRPLGIWRGVWPQQIYGNTYVGDAFNGNVNLIDWTTYTELGNPIRGLIHSATIHHDRKRIFISRFELDVETGVGLTSGQGSDPQIMLEWSKDGGRTWSLMQPWRSLGMIGAYLQRLRWLKLGQARQWIFRITCTDPIKRTIMACNADVTPGM